TSGTTTKPKRIQKSAVQIFAELSALASTFDAVPRTFVSTVPSYHLFGLLFWALLPLRLGARVVDRPVLFAHEIAAAIDEYDARVLVSTPTHLRSLVDVSMPSGVTVISSGARLAPELQVQLSLRHGWTVVDVFGSSETGGVATRTSPLV